MPTEKLLIVYFIFIDYGSNWKKIISGQRNDLQKYLLLKNAEIYIHITDTSKKNESEQFVKSIFPEASVSFSNINNFEFEAIKRVHDIANQNPDRLLIYFHTKGMSYKIPKRARVEKTLLKLTFSNWKKIAEILVKNPSLNKAGLLPSMGGKHVWFNFWYAKTNYLATLEKPVITKDRYYYEWWLGKTVPLVDNQNDTFSIFDGNATSGYDHNDASKIMWKLFHEEFRNAFFIEKKIEETLKFVRRGKNYLFRLFK